MRFFARLCVYGAFIGGVSIALLGFLGSRLDGQSDVSTLMLESRRSQALRYRMEMVAHSIAVKRAIVAEIVAGRMTLHEAVARFEEANQTIENNDSDLLPDYHRPTTEKGVYQQVLSWMQFEVAHLPAERAERILTPLEKEYESLFGPLESTVDPLGTYGRQ
jgi:hypothetical protein